MADHSDTPLNCDPDAARWAREFMEVWNKNPVMDEGWMLGWFANAIMCGADTERWKQDRLRAAGWREVAELCPENGLPCDMGCTGGWCVTLHGTRVAYAATLPAEQGVVVPVDELIGAAERWNGSSNERAMADALEHWQEMADKWLAAAKEPRT